MNNKPFCLLLLAALLAVASAQHAQRSNENQNRYNQGNMAQQGGGAEADSEVEALEVESEVETPEVEEQAEVESEAPEMPESEEPEAQESEAPEYEAPEAPEYDAMDAPDAPELEENEAPEPAASETQMLANNAAGVPIDDTVHGNADLRVSAGKSVGMVMGAVSGVVILTSVAIIVIRKNRAAAGLGSKV